jgi:hypothetical protein
LARSLDFELVLRRWKKVMPALICKPSD